EKIPEGATTVRGRIKASSCGSKDDPGLKIVIEQDGRLLSYHGKERWAGGFSDTLWYGHDHFSFCHHVVGMQAVISYRPSADKSYAGDLAELEIRDDFPASATAAGLEQPKSGAGTQPR